MKFNSQGGVSIFELVIYLPAIVIAAIVCSRHGFGRSSGWIFTLILCLVRIVGSCCQLATYHSETTGLIEAVIIMESIGVSPLLLATLGLLLRCAESLRQTSSMAFKALFFRALQLLITVALILCIVGGTNSISSTGVYLPQTTTKAGVILYLVAFVILSVVAVVIAIKFSHAANDDKRLVWAVIFALPFILVRIIYSVLSVFAHSRHFSLITGSVIIHVFMSVLEEMVVVCAYLVVGWRSDTLPPKTGGPNAGGSWKINRLGGGGAGGEGVAGGPGGPGAAASGSGRRRRQGPIHALVSAGIAAAQRKKEQKSETSGP